MATFKVTRLNIVSLFLFLGGVVLYIALKKYDENPSSWDDTDGNPSTNSTSNRIVTATTIKKLSVADLKLECDALSTIWTVENLAIIPRADCQRIEFACDVSNCREAVFDAVLTWVNGSDEAWQVKYGNGFKYAVNLDSNGTVLQKSSITGRFRDFDQLKYALRSLERNTPWVRRIFLVADNQWPVYLKPETEALRLRYVSHTELFNNYYKAKQPMLLSSPRLPCFNSIALEMLIPFIPTLSDTYVYLNDDSAFLNPTPLSFVYNTTSEKAVLRLWKVAPEVGPEFLAKNLAKEVKGVSELPCPKDAKGRCMVPAHGPIIVNKRTVLNAWNKIPELLEPLIYHPFRRLDDVKPTSLCMYLGYPEHYEVRTDPNELYFRNMNIHNYQKILLEVQSDKQTFMICLNDSFEDHTVIPEIFDRLHDAFDSKFPGKATFEK